MKISNLLSFAEPYPISVSLTLMLVSLFLFSCQDNTVTNAGTTDQLSEDSLLRPQSGSYVSLNTQESTISDDRFRVYDAMRFINQPDSDVMQLYGLSPLDVLYTPQLWYEDETNINPDELPEKELLRKRTKQASEKNQFITMVDIEHWPTKGSFDLVQESVEKYYRVADRMQKLRPDMNVGFFDMVPVKNFNHRITQETLKEWRSANEWLRPLADKVEAFYLKGYTYWQDRDKWAQNLKNNIHEARRLAKDVGDDYKKVYVVLCPEYQWGFDFGSELAHTKIGSDYWRFQLETARKYADGIVIWHKTGEHWDDDAPWWRATRMFMQSLGKGNY